MVGNTALRRLMCSGRWTLSAPVLNHLNDSAFGKPLSLCHSHLLTRTHTAPLHPLSQSPNPAPFLRRLPFHTHAGVRIPMQKDPSAGPQLMFFTHFHTHDVHMHEHEDIASTTGPTPAGVAPPRVSDEERKRLLKLVDEEDLKKRLLSTGQDFMLYVDFIKLCKDISIASTNADADALVKRLDNAGVVLSFRNIVFLHPTKVADMIASALPLLLTGEDDPRKEELQKLEKEKEEIDKAAQKQVRRMLWTAFTALSLQSLLFFRLTFWDLSWDVMEPITFFVTSSAVIGGLLFFIFTHREPSYQDLMHTLFSLKQRKLMKKHKFDANRLKRLQMIHYTLPLNSSHN